MKKNYIAPATENVMFGSSYLMADPVIGISAAASGGAGGAKSTDDSSFIE